MSLDGIRALAVSEELKEIEAALGKIVAPSAIKASNKSFPIGVVKLKRTFNLAGFRFWRVISPQNHPNYQSDLSLEGLKDWNIL